MYTVDFPYHQSYIKNNFFGGCMFFLDKSGKLSDWQQIFKQIIEDDQSECLLLSSHKYFLCFSEGKDPFFGEYNPDKNDNLIFTRKGNDLFISQSTIENHPDYDFSKINISKIDKNLFVSLKIGDQYLTSFPDKKVIPKATILQAWELFYIVPLKYVKLISDSMRNSAVWAAQNNIMLDWIAHQGWGQGKIDIIGQTHENPSNINIDIFSYPYGRLGNNLIQYMNILLIGLFLKSKNISLFKPKGFHIQGEFQIADTRISIQENIETDKVFNSSTRKLTGKFFVAKGFEAVFEQASDGTLLQCVSTISEMLHLEEDSFLFDPARTLVMHIRSGDIFNKSKIHPWYAQPPAAFYIKAAQDAEKFGIDSVLIITENYSNPTIPFLIEELPKYGFKVSVQSESISQDFSTLRQARYLVKSNSTLPEMAAMFSDSIRYLWCFERISSQFGQGDMTASIITMMPRIFRLKKIHCIIAYDTTNRATPMGQWAMTPKQYALLTEIPPEDIKLKNAYDIEYLSGGF